MFHLDRQRYALPVARVERVLRMLAIAPFPKAPEVVSGAFELHGEIVPVVDVRRRFRLPPRAPRLTDHLLLARGRHRRFALVVEHVEPVVSVPAEEVAAPATIVPGLEFVRGIARLPNRGLVFIQDLDAFLSLEEERELEAALEARHAS